MTEHSVSELEHHLFERPLPGCPSCASTDLVPITSDGYIDYLCPHCSECWHVELGAFWRVSCPPEFERGNDARASRSVQHHPA